MFVSLMVMKGFSFIVCVVVMDGRSASALSSVRSYCKICTYYIYWYYPYDYDCERARRRKENATILAFAFEVEKLRKIIEINTIRLIPQ
jgi:hypothetical protein